MYNFRTKLHHFFDEHQRIKLANKHFLGLKQWFPWLAS